MKPRVPSDYRTLLWAFGFFPALILVAYSHPRLLVWTAPLALYMGFCAGIFAHNHNHCPTFVSRTANEVFAMWVSVLYGHPIFAWIPTHNRNHHKFV
ncbi:MAG: fatty acid desaturase, partial [Myxococcota bacterium]|nr:fatty acid desaturase [Myxococcota bacterium]